MKKILIVDDERDIREMVAKKLRLNRYEAKTAASGVDALELCAQENFNLVIMDIAMPQMNGYETVERLKQNPALQDLPILLMTGHDLDPQGMAKRHEKLQVTGFIAKPSTFEELLQKVKEVIG